MVAVYAPDTAAVFVTASRIGHTGMGRTSAIPLYGDCLLYPPRSAVLRRCDRFFGCVGIGVKLPSGPSHPTIPFLVT